MTTFAYEARDASGRLINGTLDAEDLHQAGRQLRSDGKFIVRLFEASAEDLADDQAPLSHCHSRVKRDDVIYMVHQMAVMVETGVTLGEALQTLTEQCPNPHFRRILEDVSNRVHSGEPFSDALEHHKRVFPTLMVSLVRASEASGTMGPMLERVCAYLTKDRETVRAVRGATVYPIIMLSIAVAVTVFLMTFVLPRFDKIFAQRGAALPAPTRILLGASNVMIDFWYIWAVLIVALVIAMMWMRRQPFGRRAFDWLKLHAPVVGPMMNQLYVTRAMRTMGTMLCAGVPMLDMVAIVRQVTGNIYYDELWDAVDERLRQGVQLSAALSHSQLMPASVVRMIHSGEKAGRLGAVMERVAVFTESDFDDAVKRTTQLIEPALIVFMGGLVGFIAISLLLPIFSVGRVMAGG